MQRTFIQDVRGKVFSSIITNLIYLVDTGIENDVGHTLTLAAFISICVAKLESLCMANVSTHFCRYCLIERLEKIPLKPSPKRTISDHKKAVQQLSATGQNTAQQV